MEALYEPLAPGRYRASDITVGPWFPGVQHGGPPAALLMRQIESVEAPGPMQVARFTMELLRPVPVATLDVSVQVARPGRKVQLVDAVLRHDDVEVATARAWRFAYRPGSSPASPLPLDVPAPPEPNQGSFDHAMPKAFADGYHVRAVEKELLTGGFDQPGPGVAWMRLAVPVVAGEDPTPIQRAAAIADFGNGLSSNLDPGEHLYVNTELTIAFARQPRHQWVLVDAATMAGSDGLGLATTRLGDTDGFFGHALQSLLIEAR